MQDKFSTGLFVLKYNLHTDPDPDPDTDTDLYSIFYLFLCLIPVSAACFRGFVAKAS